MLIFISRFSLAVCFTLMVGCGAGSGSANRDVSNTNNNESPPPERQFLCQATEGFSCYYVEPNGQGDGSFSQPGSIEATLSKLKAGDYMYLFGGTYSTYYGDDARFIIHMNKYFRFSDPEPRYDAPIVIAGFPDEVAIVQGDGQRGCIFVDGQSHLEFRNFIVENCFNEGMRIGWDVPEQNITLNEMEFRNIEYSDNSGFVYVQGYQDVTIKHSLFHDYIPKSNGQIGSYLKFFVSKNIDVVNNHFTGLGGGIYYKHGEYEPQSGGFTRIHDNVFENLTAHGVFTNQNRTEIYNNLFLNSQGVAVHQEDGTRPPFTQDVSIHHNTFINSPLDLKQGSNDGSYMEAFGLGAKYSSVKSNVFKESDYLIWIYGTDQQYDDGVGLESNQNCFLGTDNSAVINYFGSSTFGDKGQVYNLSGWQAFGYDLSSIELELELNEEYEVPVGSACDGLGWQFPSI